MPKIEASATEKYQQILQKNPNSQVFAPLAEAYREMGLLKEAESVVRVGVKRHPTFAAGYVVYARIARDLNRLDDCLKLASRAVEIAPENIMAHQMLAEIYLLTKRPKEALKAYKMVLFLNPNYEKARTIVAKLESLTADEYEEEVFEMTKIGGLKNQFLSGTENKTAAPVNANKDTAPPATTPKALERMLSLIDAFIVRNDLNKAKMLLSDTQTEFGDHPGIMQRIKLLHSRSGAMMATSSSEEHPTAIKPLASREKAIQQRKLEALESMLRSVESYRQL